MHSEVPKCSDCQTWLYDKDWKRVTRGGEPQRRPSGAATPCWKCPKSQDGRPNPGAEMSPKNWQAYEYYLQCQVDQTNMLPRDAVVLQNNALIRMVLDSVDRQERQLAAMLGGR